MSSAFPVENFRGRFAVSVVRRLFQLITRSSFFVGLQSVTPARNNQRQKYIKQNHLLLRISAVIGRCGPHLMIVMIFVTQNNFLNGPGISDRLLGVRLVIG